MMSGKFRAALTATLLVASTAPAGTKYSLAVTIDTVNRFAFGNFGGARNSADGLQWLSCGLQSTGSIIYGTCGARDANGVMRFCQTSNSVFVALIAKLQGDSSVSFSWDQNGNCATISAYETSSDEPKVR